MSNMQVYAARAFEALKSLFALVGITALAAWFVLPIKPSAGLPAGFPSFAPIDSAAAEATEAAIAIDEAFVDACGSSRPDAKAARVGVVVVVPGR